MKIAKKVVDRVSAGLKQFKPIADQHKARDVVCQSSLGAYSSDSDRPFQIHRDR